MFRDIIIYTPMYVTLFWSMILILSRRENNISKQYLGVFMLAAFLLYLTHAVFFNGQRSAYIYFEPLYTLTSLLVYPLYYIYIKALCCDISFKPKTLYLFLPAFLFSSMSILIYLLMSSGERINYLNDFLYQRNPNLLNTTLQKMQGTLFILIRMTFATQVVFFLIKGGRLVVKYNERLANFYSNLERKNLNWVNNILIAFVLTSFASFVLNLIGRVYFFESTLLLFIPSFIFSLLFFIIGFQGYMQNYSATDLSIEENETLEENPKIKNSDSLKERLIKVLEQDKIYRNPDLRITDVSVLIQTNRTYISKLINTDLNTSFSDFVNQYRILEAKEILKSQTADKYTLQYVSELVGFGSLHSFIRVFKESEGMTPGKYRDK